MTIPSSIVNVSITSATTQPTQTGFGTPLIMDFHTNWAERVRSYTSLAGMVADGFAVGDGAYEAAAAILSQNPRPPTIKVGREVNSSLKSIDVTPVAVNSTLYELVIQTTTYQYLSDASATVAEICTGLEAAIDAAAWAQPVGYVLYDHVVNGGNVYRCTTAGTSAGTGPSGTGSAITDGTAVWKYVGPDTDVECTDGVTKITIAGDAIANWFALEITDKSLMTREDVTADGGGAAGIANDIAAVTAIDDDWYALILTRQAEAVINAAAAYIETLDNKILIAASGDDQIYSATITDDVASDLVGNSYAQTAIMYHNNPESFPEAALLGKCLPEDPGSITWVYKTLSGQTAVSLSSTQRTALDNKRCSYYVSIAGISVTIGGKMADGEYIDVQRGTDWTVARIGERIYADLANAGKIPFTDKGIDVVVNEVEGVLQDGIKTGFLAATPAPVVTAPLASAVSTADKAARTLPDIEFTATIAGAIHRVTISGVISL